MCLGRLSISIPGWPALRDLFNKAKRGIRRLYQKLTTSDARTLLLVSE